MKGELRFFELVLVQPLEIFLIESRSQWKGGLRFKIATFSHLSSCVGISILTIQTYYKAVWKENWDFFDVSSLSHGFARALPYSRFRKSVLFLAVSQERSLSHDFARALPYSAMERRNWDFFNWFSSNNYHEYYREIFLVGSRPTLSEIFLIGSQPNAWSCLIFNVLFSPNWSRRWSTKPALLYAILRNLKILSWSDAACWIVL